MHRDQSYTREEIAEKIASLPLTERAEAADGMRCLRCGRRDGSMVPVGRWRGVQVFEHAEGACD